jgi:nucleotidyltransferase substrate binding protein (TIGR01987 family)
MEPVDIRWKQRFENFCRARTLLLNVHAEYRAMLESEMACLALTQAFEISTELAWKLMKDYQKIVGIDSKNPREAIRDSLQGSVISLAEADLWMKAITMRNLTSHLYDEATLRELLAYIDSDYINILNSLHSYFKDRG